MPGHRPAIPCRRWHKVSRGGTRTADASVDPASDTIVAGAIEVGKGTRVRLNPTPQGRRPGLLPRRPHAVVAGIFHDVDGDVHSRSSLDDDPAAEFHEWYGRYMYFHPEEVEVLEEAP